MKSHFWAALRSALVISVSLLATSIPISSAKATVIYSTGFENPPFVIGNNLVGTDGWSGLNSGNGATSIVGSGFPSQGQAARIGLNPPSSAADVFAWKSGISIANPIGAGQQFLSFSVDLAIFQSTNAQNDTFSFQVSNSMGQIAAGIDFSTNSTFLFNSASGSAADGTANTFVFGTQYKLAIDIDYSTNKWNATLDGTPIFLAPQILAGSPLDFQEVDAVWTLRNTATPGDNYMVFDNYLITAIPEPSSTTLVLSGSVLFGGLMLVRRRRVA